MRALEIANAHVAVTGASSGIGAALVREFAAAGARVSMAARRRELLEKLAQECAGAKTACFAHDLSRPEEGEAFLAEAERSLGPVDVLVNNAGVQVIERTAEAKVEEGERLLRLNLLTPLRLTCRVLPKMLERKSGTIVDVASMAALAPTPGMTYYNASKGGLAAASEALRGELRGSGVHVVTVYPGIIMTDMAHAGFKRYELNLAARLQPRGEAPVLARLVRRAVERRKARVIYPRLNALARHFPAITRWVMDRFAPKVV